MTVFRTIDPEELLMPVPEFIPEEVLVRGRELFGVKRPAVLYSKVKTAEGHARIRNTYDPWPDAMRLTNPADAVELLQRIEKGFHALMKERATRLFVGEERISGDVPATAYAVRRLHIERRLLPALGFGLTVPGLLQRYVEAEAAAFRVLAGSPATDQPEDVWKAAAETAGLSDTTMLPKTEDSSC